MKYVLDESAARKLRQIFRGNLSSGSISITPSYSVRELEWAAPFELRYSSSITAGGAWLISLPDGAWSGATPSATLVNASTLDVTYTAGWYVIPASEVAHIAASGTTPVWANGWSGRIVVKIGATAPSGYVRIADIITDSSVGSKNVRQYMTSSLGSSSPYPCRIAANTGTTVTIGDIAWANGSVYHTSGDLTATIQTGVLALVTDASPSGTGTASLAFYASIEALNAAAKADIAHAYAALYKFDADGAVIADYRGAWQTGTMEV